MSVHTPLWLHCRVCRHVVNPRSECCDKLHPPCTVEGCVPDGYRIGAVPDPLGGARGGQLRELAAVAAAPTRLVDLASYQQGINLGAVKAAGFGAVNIKLTQGVNYTWSAGRAYADAARALGMGICTFSWIDNSASGATQAAYAFRQMQAIGGPAGMAHQCDCEDTSRPATWAIWRDYVSWWQDKLGRHVANYTGDWWWQPRGWNGSGLTPYLWAAPNNGYLSTYPGDASPAWSAGYGGWGSYSLLQYAVSSIVNAGGGNLSKTAIRDPAVWAALTGGGDYVGITDIDTAYLIWRMEALVHMFPRVRSGPEQGADVQLVQTLLRIDANTAADLAEDRAATVAVKTLTDLVNTGGGNVDAAPILAAIQTTRDVESAAVTALQQQNADLHAQLADLRHRLAQAGTALQDTPGAPA
jgi:hypothetical protein